MGIILLEVAIRGWGHGQKQCSGRPWHLNDAQMAEKGPKVCQKPSLIPLHQHHHLHSGNKA